MFRAIIAASLIAGSAGIVPSAVAAQALQMGAPIPGVCLFSRSAAVSASRAGLAGTARMQQIVAGINADLNPQQQQISADGAALQAQKSALSAAQFQQRGAVLQQRFQTYQQLQQLRNAQVQATRNQVEGYVNQAMDPVLDAVAVARRCAVVLERGNAYRFNAAMDLTDQVRIGLDQRLPTVQFNLVAPEAVQPKR